MVAKDTELLLVTLLFLMVVLVRFVKEFLLDISCLILFVKITTFIFFSEFFSFGSEKFSL